MKRTKALISFFCLIVTGFTFSCKQYRKNTSHATTSNKSIAKGEALAKKYCQSCHLLPDPSQLDAATWEDGVMPAMGPFLGIHQFNFKNYPSYKNDPDLPKSFYPSQPAITGDEWQNIIDYFASLSPDSLPKQKRESTITNSITTFTAEQPAFTYIPPAVCYSKILDNNGVLLFDLAAQKLLRFDKTLQLSDTLQVASTIVDIDIAQQLALNIGMINPNNGTSGNIHRVNLTKGKMMLDTTALIDQLARPVQFSSGDLNNDGFQDLVVCEFGHLRGALSWIENKGDTNFSRHLLKSQPGAIRAIINDYNKDGLKDIWALFSQGDESIILFTNKRNGRFEEKIILRFPPMYGSTYFEFADINKDGHQDIIYTCGDNADYSIVLKPYHGVYIYLNDGSNNFKQSYFYPINGCYKAMARDFDNDGDLDIATISFFADYTNQPEEGFVYLQQQSDKSFKPMTLPQTTSGRWLTMDCGDVDGDGKEDILLGNFSVRPSATQPRFNWQQGPPFLLLKNTGK